MTILRRGTLVVAIAGVALMMLSETGAGRAAAADTLVCGKTRTEGNFEGFERARILFRNTKGRLVRQQSSQVSKLILENPLNVVVTMKGGGKKAQETMVCGGYEKSKFIFERDEKRVDVPVDKISKVEPSFESLLENQMGRSASVEEINTDDLMTSLGAQPPSPAQTAAVSAYRGAWSAYQKFAGETAALKSGMEQSGGAARVAIIDQLRTKKHEEQVVLGDLDKAVDMLSAAFPQFKQ
ncbi:MAG: hypothetical protein WCL44_13465 [bacterium]